MSLLYILTFSAQKTKIMTLKHAILFYFWKLYIRVIGFKIGTIVKIYSDEKGKNIKGCVTSISGDSIDNNKYNFYIGVNLFEPLQGFDSRFYSWGSYNPKNFTYNPTDRVFYKTN